MTTAIADEIKVQAEEDEVEELERRRFTTSEYLKMAELGILSPDEKLELIDGQIFKKMSPIGTPHIWCVNRLNRLFSAKLFDKAFVSPQNPISLDDYNDPEPDIVLLPLKQTQERPSAKDALLVVEVSDKTVRIDRNIKAPLYARFGVMEVWLVDLNAKRIEAHREPKDGVYRQTLIFDETQNIAPMNFPDIAFSVAEILGTKPLSNNA